MGVQGCEMALVCQMVVSQLRNTLPNGASVAKRWISRRGKFAAISQLRNGYTGLWNGTRVPKDLFAAAKIFAEGVRRLQNHFAARSDFRSGSLLAAKFHRPCSLLAFEFLLIPNFLLSPLLTFLLILIIPKTYVTSKQIRIKALKSKLKHWNQNLNMKLRLKQVKNKTKRYGLASL